MDTVEKAPAISIILSVRNAEKYITDCLTSIVNQTLTKYEVIILNDASIGNGFKIAKERFSLYPQILFIDNTQSLRTGEARNIGLQYAKGEYVYFMDGRDMLVDDALETMYQLAKQNGLDIVHMDTYCKPYNPGVHYGEPAEVQMVWDTIKNSELLEDAAKRVHTFFLEQDPTMKIWSNLYSRNFLLANQVDFLPINYGQDIPFLMKCFIATSKISTLHGMFYIYRQWAELLPEEQVFDAASRLNEHVRSLIMGLRHIEELSDMIPDGIEINVFSLQMTYFHKVFAKIRTIFDSMENTQQRTRLICDTYDNLKGMVGKDAFLVNILLYSIQMLMSERVPAKAET